MGTSGSSSRIAIIGGGWAGLAAAVTLCQHGASVTLFETGREPGGRARRVRYKNGHIDNGQHMLLGAYTETLKLMELVLPGCTGNLFLRMPLTLDFPGHFHLSLPRLPSPLHLAYGFLAARGLSLKTKLAIVKVMTTIKNSTPGALEHLSVSQLLDGQPSEAIDLIWSPLCLSALNTPLNIASADVFANVLRDALTGPQSHSDMLLPRTDLSLLFPDPAIDYIRRHGGTVELGMRIIRVTPTGREITIESQDGAYVFDQLILACAPHHAAQLLAPDSRLAHTVTQLESFRYQPIVTTYLDYPGNVRLPSPFIGLNDEAAHFAFDQRYTHDHPGRLTVVVSAEHPVPEGGREGRIHHTHQALENVLGPLPQPFGWQIIEEKRATFECHAALNRPEHMTEDSRIFLAGDYTKGPYPATLEGAVRSGVQCAKLAWSMA